MSRVPRARPAGPGSGERPARRRQPSPGFTDSAAGYITRRDAGHRADDGMDAMLRSKRFLCVLVSSAVLLAGAASERAVHAGPPRESALIHLARAAMAEGDYARSEAALRRLLSDQPDHAEAAEMLRALQDHPANTLEPDEQSIADTLAELGHGFRRSESRHFVVLSNASPSWTRQRQQLLERTYHQYQRLMRRLDLEAIPPKRKMLCVLFADHDEYSEFARLFDGVEAPWVAGYYASRTNRCVFYDDTNSPSVRGAMQQIAEFDQQAESLTSKAREAKRSGRSQEGERLEAHARKLTAHATHERKRLDAHVREISTSKAIHEATHLIAFNCGLQTRTHRFPFWITEGLAVSMETGDPDKPFGPDFENELRAKEFREAVDGGRFMPLRAFVAIATPDTHDHDEVGAMYAQADALFRYLFRFERESLSHFFRDVAREKSGLVSQARLVELFESRFGDPRKLERRMLRHYGFEPVR
ncbi:MAG: DUF1570 domain-containing protein [Planctomycetota bacterium]